MKNTRYKLREEYDTFQQEKHDFDDFRSTTNNKLNANQEMITTLKETNDTWQKKFENEEKNHQKVRNELLALRTELHELKLADRDL